MNKIYSSWYVTKRVLFRLNHVSNIYSYNQLPLPNPVEEV